MEMPIRVLVLDTVMDRGGAETMIMNYFKNINRNKIVFDFLVNREYKAAYEDEIKALGGRIYRMCPMYPKNFKRYKKEIRRFLINHSEYKIIHSNLEERSYLPLKEAKKLGVKIRISHAHNAPKGFDIKTIARYYFRARLKKVVTHMFACGKMAGLWLYGKKDFDKVIIENNAIDARKYEYNEILEKSAREQFNLNGKFVIGHVGRFFTQKNHEFLIDVFNEVYKRDKSAVLVLVGDGELRSHIEEKVKLLGLSNCVKFLGVRSDVNYLMQSFDLFLLPSLFEGVPVTMIEAQSASLKCIISDKVPKECIITDNVEVIGLDEDIKTWADKILKYKNSYKKKSMYEEIAAKKFDIKENALIMEKFYVNAIKEYGGTYE